MHFLRGSQAQDLPAAGIHLMGSVRASVLIPSGTSSIIALWILSGIALQIPPLIPVQIPRDMPLGIFQEIPSGRVCCETPPGNISFK